MQVKAEAYLEPKLASMMSWYFLVKIIKRFKLLLNNFEFDWMFSPVITKLFQTPSNLKCRPFPGHFTISNILLKLILEEKFGSRKYTIYNCLEFLTFLCSLKSILIDKCTLNLKFVVSLIPQSMVSKLL